MRPFDFNSASPMPATQNAGIAGTAQPQRDPLRLSLDLIGLVLVSTATFAVFWMIAALSAALLFGN